MSLQPPTRTRVAGVPTCRQRPAAGVAGHCPHRRPAHGQPVSGPQPPSRQVGPPAFAAARRSRPGRPRRRSPPGGAQAQSCASASTSATITGSARPPLVRLKALCSPGDHGEPISTLMMPNEA
jgi:hypothetical protein